MNSENIKQLNSEPQADCGMSSQNFSNAFVVGRQWDGVCDCGHKHSEHAKIVSHNYSAGSCSIKGCKCKYFNHNIKQTRKMEQQKTLGEARVRTDFNVSGDDVVNVLKSGTANLINVCEQLKGDGNAIVNGEKVRLISLAQTTFEEAAMWAVKAATF